MQLTGRVLIADDHKILREGLRSLLEREPTLEVVAEASDGRSAVRLACELAPDVVIIDVVMRELNGVDATRQILAEHSAVKVIALSMHADRRYVLGMLRAGARGYVLKDSAFEELVLAIRTVMAGEIYLSPSITCIILEDYLRQQTAAGSSSASPLTPREREVLQLIAEGSSTRQIAASLRVSIKTVETHRRNIMRKLRLGSVAELTKFAVREGLTPLDG